jgi:NAD(P)-dependent dehydrogenase (short-subunit alcohol dehydrogenase family)
VSVLRGKRAIITGAGGAIGRATALRFTREGASVGLIDINAADLSATSEQVRRLDGTAVDVACDVRHEGDVVAAVREVAAKFGGLDILFANAGVMPHSDESVLEADFDHFWLFSAAPIRRTDIRPAKAPSLR